VRSGLIVIKPCVPGDGTMVGMLRTLILVLLLIPGPAAAVDSGAAKNAPRLERMQIEIWPEYDRPAALVILKGELAGDVALPAALAIRIPASAGGPAAVAYAAAMTGPLFNLPYDRSAAPGFILLRFAVPERFFHVEFYDPLATGTPERSYRYLWPGDLPVGALHVIVQEPAAARGVSIQPELGQWSDGTDGMRYRAAQLGPVEQGKSLSIEIRYAKSDPRTSVEILKAGVPLSSPASVTSTEERDAFRRFMATGAFALLAAGAALVYFLWWRRRPGASAGEAGGGTFCAQCGHALAPGDRFCPKCGTPRA